MRTSKFVSTASIFLLLFIIFSYPLFSDETVLKREIPSGKALAVTLGTSAVSTVLFNVFWILGDETYNRYVQTDSVSQAAVLERYWKTYDLLSYIFAGIGTVSLGFSLPLMGGDYSSGNRIQESESGLEALLRQRENLLEKYSVSFSRTFLPRLFLSTAFASLTANALLSTIGMSLYYNMDQEPQNTGINPVVIASISTGVFSSLALISSLITQLIYKTPLSWEKEIGRKELEIRKVLYIEENNSLTQEINVQALTRMENRLAEVSNELAAFPRKKKRYNIGVGITAGAGILGLGGMTAAYILNKKGMDNFFVNRSSIVIYGITGGAGISIAGILALNKPKERKLVSEKVYLETRIREVKKSTPSFN